MRLLEAFELYRFYHNGDEETFALRGVSLTVDSGEIVAVVGPSGSGKSTLLACLAGLDEPSGGRVEIMGRRMTRQSEVERGRLRATYIGVFPQSGNLFGHLSVEDNIRLQSRLSPMRVEASMDALDLARLGRRLPAELSGGERARAGLAVALVNGPALLLADEPTAEVDSATEAIIFKLLATRRRQGLATLLASHSPALIAKADRLLRLHDGRLIDA